MFPFFPMALAPVVLGVQAITLDIAGFGLTTMSDHARRRGDEQAARKAQRMGWTLISLMIVTVSLVTLSVLIPPTTPFVDNAEKALLLARVVVTVFYGHIVHSLRQAGTAYENQVSRFEHEVSRLGVQLGSKAQEVSSLHQELDSVSSVQSAQVSSLQQQVSTVQHHLDSKEQEVSSLRDELDRAKRAAETLREHLDSKAQEVSSLRGERDSKAQEVSSVQAMLHEERLRVSSLRDELDTLSHVQHEVSSGQKARPSTGSRVQHDLQDGHDQQGKVLRLDTHRPRSTPSQEDRALETQIRALLTAEPGLSGRAIAARLGCSPTTAAKWKSLIESEQSTTHAANA